MKKLNTTLLIENLEDYFVHDKEYLLSNNKYCLDGKSFLTNTYLVSQFATTNDGIPKYRAVVFEDLSGEFTDRLFKQIKTEINNQGFDCETVRWSSYNSY